MYTQEISIVVADAANLHEALSEFEFLTGSYRGSGQTLGKSNFQYVEGSRIVGVEQSHEADSLDSKYNNFYVNLRIERLEALCGNNLQVKTIGQSHNANPVCTCTKSSFYLLITDYVSIHSPVKCGTCFEVVPLYKLPAYYDNGYMPILSWESNYQSVDTLQMNCEVGEEWALEQLQTPGSELSTQGREICATITKQTETPTYYYLHNYKETTVVAELDSKCPVCNSEWLLTQPLADGIFNFKCDNCKLLSSFSPNILG